MRAINFREFERFVWNKINGKHPKLLRKAFYSGPGYEPELIQETWKNIGYPAREYLQSQKIPN